MPAAVATEAKAKSAQPRDERARAPPDRPNRDKTAIGRKFPADRARSPLLAGNPVQAKGFVSSPDDAAEVEAERVAAHVVAMPEPVAAPGARATAAVHRATRASGAVATPIPSPPPAPPPAVAQPPPAPAAPATVTTSAPAAGGGAAGGTADDGALIAAVRSAASGGFEMSRKTRAYMEPRFGADFSAVRIHTGPEARRLANRLGARAFTYGRHIFFNDGEYQPDTPAGLQLLAHELTHTIQQREAVQRKAAASAPRVSQRTSRQASRLGISDALDYFAEAAYNIPGFRMFTILIGVNPINMQSVEASAANILRAIVEFLPGGNVIVRVLDSYGIFDKVGTWIEQQLASLGITGSAIRAAIMEFLDSLSWRDIFRLGSVWERAKRIFLTPIQRIIAFAQGLFAQILQFVREAVLAPLARLAEGTRFYPLLKAVIGRDPVTGEPAEGGPEAIIGGFMTMIGQEEIWQNIQRAKAIPRAWAWFQGAMAGLRGLVSSIPDRFMDGLRSLEIMDFVVLPRAFAKIAGVFGGFVADFGAWALGTVLNLLQIIVEVVAPGVMPYIRRAAGAFQTIIRNPGRFVSTLIRAAQLGFRQFARNFLRHLQASLVGWLTGAMAGANIYIPQGFNLREILKFVLSVLGLTWQNIRAKLVRATNEATVVALETGFDIVRTLVTEGPAAAWQKILETLANLKQMAIDAIMDFVKSRVVQAAVTRLLSMLSPAGAFIQAVIATYNTVMFFVERLRQIAQVAAAFIDGIAAIAAGNIGPAANRVEQTMAGLLTLVISFLARIAGLGRVSDAVTNLINRVRAPIDRALDRLVAWIVQQARRLGRFILQAGVPADPAARLRLASRAAIAIAQRLPGRATRPILVSALAVLQARYGVTAIDPFERGGRWFARMTINPTVVTDLNTSPPTTGGPILGPDGRPASEHRPSGAGARPYDGPAMGPLIGKLTQVIQMFTRWARQGTSPVAQQMLRQAESARERAQAIDEDRRAGRVVERARIDAINDQLRAIQVLDADYQLVSIGQMSITISQARRQMARTDISAYAVQPPRTPQRLDEYRRQLREQEDGINSMVASEWVRIRAEFSTTGRREGEATMRRRFATRSGLGTGSGLAAPHNPDQSMAGYEDPTGEPADSPINSHIGSQNRMKAQEAQTLINQLVPVPAQPYTQLNFRLFIQ
jgi:hypothetical protein